MRAWHGDACCASMRTRFGIEASTRDREVGKNPGARVTTIDRIDARPIPRAPSVGSVAIARGHSRRAEHRLFESRPLQSLGFACARRSVRGARPAQLAVPVCATFEESRIFT